MQITAETPRVEKKIADIAVQVPQPFAEGQPLTAATAAMLNQTFSENISNNLRAKLALGHVASEGADAIPHTSETAQPLIDAYVAEYEPGVRRGGGGEARVTDPVEREARKIAKAKATEIVKANGLKPADVDLGKITDALFEKNKDMLMAEGKKIVKALEAAKAKGAGLDLEGLDLSAKPAESATTEG